MENPLALLYNKEYHYNNMHDVEDELHLYSYISQFEHEKTIVSSSLSTSRP